MLMPSRHPTAERLLLLCDGELSGPSAWLTRRHLQGCAACRAKAARLQTAAIRLAAFHDFTRDVLPPSAAARALLKARLNSAPVHAPLTTGRWAIATATLLLASLAGFARYQQQHAAPQPIALADLLVPDSNLTPGAVRAVALADLCSADVDREDDQDPAVTPSLQQTVFREYGMDQPPGRKYQVDYLISPQLGGTADLQNLWPQPYGAGVWNAQAKDALEGRLHQMVCAKQIDLASAQREIATDWIAAYQRVFHTPQPR